jgi:hypothetical protein
MIPILESAINKDIYTCPSHNSSNAKPTNNFQILIGDVNKFEVM